MRIVKGVMKNTLSYDLNRPVHLGRRDEFMERASDVFHKCRLEKSGVRRMQQIDTTLYYLQSALDHSSMAGKAGATVPAEESLVLVIKTIVFYLQSIIAVMENEAQLKNKESPLWKFIHGHGKSQTTKDVVRSSKLLMEDVSHFFRIIEAPYAALRQQLLEEMSDGDRVKYANSSKCLRQHAAARSHQRHAVRHGRTFFQAPAVKY